MAGFSRNGILCRNEFSASPTEIGRYSPAPLRNTPVFGEPKPETGSIALRAGQNGQKFSSLPRSLKLIRIIDRSKFAQLLRKYHGISYSAVRR